MLSKAQTPHHDHCDDGRNDVQQVCEVSSCVRTHSHILYHCGHSRHGAPPGTLAHDGRELDDGKVQVHDMEQGHDME